MFWTCWAVCNIFGWGTSYFSQWWSTWCLCLENNSRSSVHPLFPAQKIATFIHLIQRIADFSEIHIRNLFILSPSEFQTQMFYCYQNWTFFIISASCQPLALSLFILTQFSSFGLDFVIPMGWNQLKLDHDEETESRRLRRGRIFLFREAHRKWVSHVTSLSQSETAEAENRRRGRGWEETEMTQIGREEEANRMRPRRGRDHMTKSLPVYLGLNHSTSSSLSHLGLFSASPSRPLPLCFSKSEIFQMYNKSLTSC